MNSTASGIDWHQMFVPSGSLVELVVRASVMYLLRPRDNTGYLISRTPHPGLHTITRTL